MSNVRLHDFIGANREELIRRCQAKVATRSISPPTQPQIEHGVPLFLSQLIKELRSEHSQTDEIVRGATEHGHDLLLQGFTVSQVVHDYGDVCQSVTDLAVELAAPISTDDFRTLNRCLDDAIAGAVSEHAREQEITRDGVSDALRHLTDTAITAFEVLQSGSVGVTGKTGGVVHRSLMGIRALIDRPIADAENKGPHSSAAPIARPKELALGQKGNDA